MNARIRIKVSAPVSDRRISYPEAEIFVVLEDGSEHLLRDVVKASVKIDLNSVPSAVVEVVGPEIDAFLESKIKKPRKPRKKK